MNVITTTGMASSTTQSSGASGSSARPLLMIATLRRIRPSVRVEAPAGDAEVHALEARLHHVHGGHPVGPRPDRAHGAGHGRGGVLGLDPQQRALLLDGPEP